MSQCSSNFSFSLESKISLQIQEVWSLLCSRLPVQCGSSLCITGLLPLWRGKSSAGETKAAMGRAENTQELNLVRVFSSLHYVLLPHKKSHPQKDQAGEKKCQPLQMSSPFIHGKNQQGQRSFCLFCLFLTFFNFRSSPLGAWFLTYLSALALLTKRVIKSSLSGFYEHLLHSSMGIF